jgi:putative endonuclease
MGLFDRFRKEVRNTLFPAAQDRPGSDLGPSSGAGMEPGSGAPGKTPAEVLRPRTARQVAGQAGEDAALRFLLSQRMSLVERNFRCRGGEIDLVMSQGGTLVFVEVRKRGDRRFGGAAASITSRKQARLILAGQVFLQRYRMPPACRFDVIAIDGTQLEWLKDAIQA